MRHGHDYVIFTILKLSGLFQGFVQGGGVNYTGQETIGM